jgi:ribosome-associated protein
MTPEFPNNLLTIGPGVEIPHGEFTFSFSRSGGPGGQNVNKVNTKAELRWPVVKSPSLPYGVRARFLAKFENRITTDGELVLTSQRYRDQASNVEDCLQKLQEMLGEVLERPIVRRATKPTRASQARRVDSKRENSKKKQDRRAPRGDD